MTGLWVKPAEFRMWQREGGGAAGGGGGGGPWRPLRNENFNFSVKMKGLWAKPAEVRA